MGNRVKSNGKTARVDKEFNRMPHSSPKRSRKEKIEYLLEQTIIYQYNCGALGVAIAILLMDGESSPVFKWIFAGLALMSGLNYHIKGE